MHLFLDTNIYLGFYRLSEDNLDQLKKLSDTVRSGETVLYLTDQVRDEFRGNRESTIAESLATLKDQKVPSQFPQLFTSLPGYPDVRATLKQAEEQLSSLQEAARQAIDDGTLQADVLIAELFAAANSVKLNADIWNAAQMRILLGNPPGKANSYGDAVNWECLLAEVPNREDLVVVTADRDYMSKLDTTQLNEFLRVEWETRKRSKIAAHQTLRTALKEHHPEIRLVPQPEPEKEHAIAQLTDSGNFKSTHAAIRALSRFDEFSPTEVAALVEAAISNSQVHAILQDDDVWAFFENLVRTYADDIDSAQRSQLTEELARPQETT